MPANILKHEKFYSIGVNFKSPTLEEIKQNILKEVLNLEPILTRAVRCYDHLVEIDPNVDPPKLKWKSELLKELQIDYLRGVCTLLYKVKEEQQRTY